MEQMVEHYIAFLIQTDRCTECCQKLQKLQLLGWGINDRKGVMPQSTSENTSGIPSYICKVYATISSLGKKGRETLSQKQKQKGMEV
jgi:hypothetical protein